MKTTITYKTVRKTVTVNSLSALRSYAAEAFPDRVIPATRKDIVAFINSYDPVSVNAK